MGELATEAVDEFDQGLGRLALEQDSSRLVGKCRNRCRQQDAGGEVSEQVPQQVAAGAVAVSWRRLP